MAKNLFKKVALPYLVMAKGLHENYNVRKLNPTMLGKIVSGVWCEKIDKTDDGFVWNQEEFNILFFVL
jgi:hypothetical protein